MTEETGYIRTHTSASAVSAEKSGELLLERISCPLCGSDQSTVVLKACDNLCQVPGDFCLERCLHCGHLFMNPRPAAESLAACYPAHYGPHQTATPAVTLQPDRPQQRRPWYLRYLPLRYVPGLKALYCWLLDDRSQPVISPKTVSGSMSAAPQALEIGCATGRYLQQLQQLGWTVTGVEPGERPAALARAAGLNVHCGTLEDTSLPTDIFDLAAAWMVLEHVPGPRETLQSLRSLLKPGGLLLFSIPNAGCWEAAVFGRYWYVWELPRHLHQFTPASIRRLLTECGFADIRIVHQRTLLNVVGSLGIAILSRWPDSRIGRWLKQYPDSPTLAGQLLLAPSAHLLAILRQGGRLTISARRPLVAHSQSAEFTDQQIRSAGGSDSVSSAGVSR